MQVYKSISQIIGELSKIGISKDNVNKMQGYKFRGIDDIYNALAPLFSKHGVIVFPRVISHSQTERTSKKGDAIFYTIVECEFDFVSAEDGSKHVVKTFGEAMDSADKSTNKAMSAAYKYACFQAFCIPTEGDNDADATTHSVEPTETYQQLCDRLQDEITQIKIGIDKGDLRSAAYAWFSLGDEDKISLWKSPGSGGIFSTKERDVMKSEEFRKSFEFGDK